MMTTPIPAGQIEQYRRAARARWQAEKQSLAARRERAWELARQAADLLKARYGAQRVLAFGSLARPGRFTRWSDIDLAAWGLTPGNWLQAMSEARGLSGEIEINVVDVTCCSPELLAVIEREGVAL